MKKIAVFISGSGSDMQSVIDGCESGYIGGKVVCVVASKEGIYGLERAEKHGIDSAVFALKDYDRDCVKRDEAIINYIALLGWAPKSERELFTLEELKTEFDIDGLSKSPSIFDPLKLRAINAEYIRRLSPEEFSSAQDPILSSR